LVVRDIKCIDRERGGKEKEDEEESGIQEKGELKT
jgi:hypothetical protein